MTARPTRPGYHSALACPFCERELADEACLNVECFLFANIVPLPVRREFRNPVPQPIPIPPNYGRPIRRTMSTGPG